MESWTPRVVFRGITGLAMLAFLGWQLTAGVGTADVLALAAMGLGQINAWWPEKPEPRRTRPNPLSP